MVRPLPPANISQWAGAVERDLDRATTAVGVLQTNVEAAQQGISSAGAALVNLNSTSNFAEIKWSQPITVGAGWSASPDLPTISIQTNTSNRLEIQYGGAILNGSGRICFSATGDDDSPYMERAIMLTDYSQVIALTGSASFPASGYRTAILDVASDSLIVVKLEVYGQTAGVVLSGSSISVRPTI